MKKIIGYQYIGDIVISTIVVSKMLSAIRRVLKLCNDNGLPVNLEKLKFCAKQITYVVWVTSNNKIEPDRGKIQGIVASKPPGNKAELTKYLGAAGYFTDFIPNFAEIAEPMIPWGNDQDKAFQEIKRRSTILEYS